MANNLFNINVYKPKKNKKASHVSYPLIFIIYSLLCFLLMGCTLLWLKYNFSNPQKKIIEDKEKLSRFLRLESDELLTMVNRLDQRKRSYLKLKQETIPWYDKLFEISQNISNKIWFDKIEYQAKDNKSKTKSRLIITGFIYSTIKEEYYAEIGNFVMALNQSPSIQRDFQSLNIEYIKKSSGRETGNIEFKLSGEMKAYR